MDLFLGHAQASVKVTILVLRQTGSKALQADIIPVITSDHVPRRSLWATTVWY